jgi:hypothetical protein
MSGIGTTRAITTFDGAREFGRAPARAAASALSTSSSSSASLQLRTKDGDTVSLSLVAARSSTRAFASDGSSTVSTEESADSLEIEVQVEGQLDKKELSDISKLLRKLSKVLGLGSTASAGREDKSAPPNPASWLAPRGNSSIESYSFSYERSTSVQSATIGLYA